MKLKLKSIIIKIQTFTFLFAWITFILFAVFHPDLQSLTNALYQYLLITPFGILILDPRNTERDDDRDYIGIPLLCLYTLLCDFIVWEFFITSIVN